MNLIIREMEESDFSDVSSLWQNELGNSSVTVESVAAVYTKMRRNDSYHTFVAVTGDAVVGVITAVEVIAFEYPAGYMKINGLAVKREFQGMGIGRKLVLKVEDIARRKGVSRIGLATGFQRKDAHAFYEHLGYVSGSYYYGKTMKCRE